MKKPYLKPIAKRVEVDSQIIRTFTRQGFIEVFWEELQAQRKENPKISEKSVFDSLNDKFYVVFNEFRYSSYDSFKHIKNS
jgi:hypothetical protein